MVPSDQFLESYEVPALLFAKPEPRFHCDILTDVEDGEVLAGRVVNALAPDTDVPCPVQVVGFMLVCAMHVLAITNNEKHTLVSNCNLLFI